MSNQITELTPEQEALMPVWAARWTALGWHCVPFGTTDRAASRQAAIKIAIESEAYKGKQYVQMNHLGDFRFEFLEDHKHFKKGDVEVIQRVGNKTWAHQDPKTVYVISGVFPDLTVVADNWLGRDAKEAIEQGQFAAHAASLATYCRDVLHLHEHDNKVEALDEYCRNVGLIYRFDNAILVADKPTGILFNHYPEEQAHQAIWTAQDAAKHNIEYA